MTITPRQMTPEERGALQIYAEAHPTTGEAKECAHILHVEAERNRLKALLVPLMSQYVINVEVGNYYECCKCRQSAATSEAIAHLVTCPYAGILP